MAVMSLSAVTMFLAACSSDEDIANQAPKPLLGTHYGLAVTEKLDEGDRETLHNLTIQSLNALPDGATREWTNAVDGTSGTVTVMSSSETAEKGRCRLFAQKFYRDGAIEKAQGEACFDPNKGWILQTFSPG